MTMILGINYEKFAYLSADTRVKFQNGKHKDDIQKIAFLPKKKIILAAAGNLRIAKGIVQHINENIYAKPLNKADIKDLARKFLQSEEKSTIFSRFVPKKTAFLFHFFDGRKTRLHAFTVSFGKNEDGLYEPNITDFEIKKGEYVVIVKDHKNGININKIPPNVEKYLDDSNYESITYYDYAIATDGIFQTSIQGKDHIGGKTTTIKTHINPNGSCKYSGIRGLKSLIHRKDEFQDVSSASYFDLSKNCFYLRDLRNDGKIITNIEYLGLGTNPKMLYDSCPTDSGEPDKYYTPFTDYPLSTYTDLEI